MIGWLIALGSIAVVLITSIVVLGWYEKRKSEARWKESMHQLTVFCEKFAEKHHLVCVSGVDEWPFGWPRIHGQIDDAAFSLAFGWKRKDIWVASMRVRAAGRMSGEFRVGRAYVENPQGRGRVVKTGDREFDEVFVVSLGDAVDVQSMLTPKVRQCLLGIAGAELAYRDGVVILSWPCDAYLGDAASRSGEFGTIDFGYDALSEIAQTSRSQRAYR